MASSFEGLAAELSRPTVRVLEATPAAALLPFAKSERRWAQDSLADLITSSAFSTVGELLKRGDIVLSGREHRALREVLFGVVRRLAVHLVPPSATAKPSATAAKPGASRPKPHEAPAPPAPVTLPDVVGPVDGARLDAWAAAHGATAVLKALALALAPEHLHLALHRALWPREAVATVREALLATPRRLDDEFTQAQAALLDMLREYPARVARARAHDEAWLAARAAGPRRPAWAPLIADLSTLRARLRAANPSTPLEALPDALRFVVGARAPHAVYDTTPRVRIDLDRSGPPSTTCDTHDTADCAHALAAVHRLLDTLEGELSPKTEAALTALIETPPWMRALDQLVAQTRADTTPSEVELDWWVTSPVHPGFVSVSPVVRRRGKRGEWLNAKATRAGTVLKDDLDLDARDRLVLELAALVDRTGGYDLGGSVVAALVGHPRVRVGPTVETSRPYTVVEVEARLKLQRKEAMVVGNLHVDGVTVAHDRQVVEDTRGQRLLVARVTKAASAALERVGEAMKKLTPGALPEFAMRLALLGETLPIDALELVPVTVVPRRDAWSLRLATRDDGALEAALTYQALAGGPWLVPGEGSPRALAPDGTTALRVTDRDVGAERAHAEALWRGWGLTGEVSAVAVLTEHDAALRLISAVRAEPHGVHVEWTTRPLRVLPRARARNLRLAITAAADWFAVEGELISDEYKLALAQLLDAARQRSSFVQVADDTWVELEATLLERLRTLDPHVRAVRHRLEIGALSVPALAEVVTDVAVPDRWSAIAERARRAGDVRPAVPRTLQAELRPYQQEGYTWMARLAAWGAGAVLADDMGLGKTVQAIALLLHRAPEGPALVVTPTSVTHNWRRELARFAPTLRVRGLRGEDSCDPATLGPGDVLVLSYGVLVLEREALAPVRLASVVYDEAQVIKNPASQRSQAARALTADWRLALTGTPVENHLGDLWAIMAAVSPGLLGSWEHFRSRWVGVSGPALDGLRRLVQPFVLRRAKGEVLRELPPKTEVVVDIELSSAERALYEDARLAAAAALRGLGAELSTGAGRLHVLAALSRLRQLACDASLVVPGEAPPSSKLARLGELTAALLDEGHSVLVFSQFVKLLDRAEAELSRRALPLIRLDGSTPAAARGERVDRFQASGPTVMLVSLRAGGTGLNLTAADYVFHLDPWWNPAVEDQATDRAHRIGQTRPVTVYRMVSRGTIEAAILGLHAEKRGLAAELLEGTGSAQPLSAEDLLALIGDAPDGPSPREPELDEGDDGAGAEDTPSEPPLSLPPARRAAPRSAAPAVLAPPAPDVTPATPRPAPATPPAPSTPAPSATPPRDAAPTTPPAGLDAVLARVRAELTAHYAASTATRYAQVLARMVEWGHAHGARDAAQVVSLYRAAIDAGQRPESERVVVRSLAARLEAR